MDTAHAVAPTPDERHHPFTVYNPRVTDIPHWTHPHSSVASAHTNPCTRITNPATCHTHKPVELYTPLTLPAGWGAHS